MYLKIFAYDNGRWMEFSLDHVQWKALLVLTMLNQGVIPSITLVM
jgi:hypothetical protein